MLMTPRPIRKRKDLDRTMKDRLKKNAEPFNGSLFKGNHFTTILLSTNEELQREKVNVAIEPKVAREFLLAEERRDHEESGLITVQQFRDRAE